MIKKSSLSLLIAVSASLLLCVGAFANSVNVGLSVTMPGSNSIIVKLTEVDSNGTATPTDDIWGTSTDITAGGSINFTATHPMILNTTTGVYSTGYYYVLDVSPGSGGWSGSTGVVMSYISGTPDIADHSVATLVKAVYVSPTQTTETPIGAGKYKFTNIPGAVSVGTLQGGWLRVYVGLSTGEAGEPTGVTPFTAASASGTYSGTLTLTYTGS